MCSPRYIRDKDLFTRWCEFAAFTVVYRSHQGTLPDDNWQFYTTTDSMRHFFRMSQIFKAWKFYRTLLINEAATKGWPVARHMMLVYPGNKAVHSEDLRYQFMIGTELLIAPVHTNNTNTINVFLPHGITWVHIWSNISYHGNIRSICSHVYVIATGNNKWINIPAPVGCPVVLYPHQSTIGKQFVNNLMNSDLVNLCNKLFY